MNIKKKYLLRTRLDVSPKKTYKWLISTFQDAQHHFSLGKCKLKPQPDTTSCPLGWLKSKLETITSMSENGEKLEPSRIVDGKVKWYSSLAVIQNVRHGAII